MTLVMLEGDLAEIDDYTYEDIDRRYDDAHGNWLFTIKDDHPEDLAMCGLCSMNSEGTARYFKLVRSIRAGHVYRMNQSIYVDGKEI